MPLQVIPTTAVREVEVVLDEEHPWIGNDDYFRESSYRDWGHYTEELGRMITNLGFIPRQGDSIMDEGGDMWDVDRVVFHISDRDPEFRKVVVWLSYPFPGAPSGIQGSGGG